VRREASKNGTKSEYEGQDCGEREGPFVFELLHSNHNSLQSKADN